MPGNERDIQVSFSDRDWGLHRTGPKDQARHAQKVRESIKANLPEIIAEEAIITSDGRKIVKVPIRSLELPRFKYGRASKEQGVGQGAGQIGDVVGQVPGPGQKGAGRGRQAGDTPGIDYYEVDTTVDELAALIFEDFGLPGLLPKGSESIETEQVKFTEIRKRGLMGNLAKKEMIAENMRRNAMKGGKAEFKDVIEEDLRFRTWETEIKKESNAVVIAMRDVSGSMGEFEKYISRSFYFWMVRFLRQKYQNVQIAFITHHTEAKEVNEQEFFTLGEGGGTKVSSAYKKSLEIIGERYNPERWNIYPFHFSDGDNWGIGDNEQSVELINKHLEICNLFGYGEIHAGPPGPNRLSGIYRDAISDPRYVGVTINDKNQVYPALQTYFGKKLAA